MAKSVSILQKIKAAAVSAEGGFKGNATLKEINEVLIENKPCTRVVFLDDDNNQHALFGNISDMIAQAFGEYGGEDNKLFLDISQEDGVDSKGKPNKYLKLNDVKTL